MIPQKGVAGVQIISITKWRYRLPKFKGIVSADYLSTCRSIPKGFFHLLNKCFTADSNALCPLFVDSLNWAVLGENRSIKIVSQTFLKHFIRNVNCLAWPDPSPFIFLATFSFPPD